MAEGLTYGRDAAAGYDRAFGYVSACFVPSLVGAACLAPGMRVLDIATGTGLVAEAALAAVGSTGQAYVSLPEEARRAMREKVRRNLSETGGPIAVDMEVRIGRGRW